MFTQVNPPVPMVVLGKGPGVAFAVIDPGMEFDLQWVVVLDDGVEVWVARNSRVRVRAH